MTDMSDYYHEETILELESEIRLLKAQQDELLQAARDIIRATKWLKDERHELAYMHLEAAIAKVEADIVKREC